MSSDKDCNAVKRTRITRQWFVSCTTIIDSKHKAAVYAMIGPRRQTCDVSGSARWQLKSTGRGVNSTKHKRLKVRRS